MFKRNKLWMLGIVGLFAIAGCATGRDYQTDLNALNAKITAMQAQLSSKDEEVARLKSQVDATHSEQNVELTHLQNENSILSQKLKDAQEDLAAAKRAQKKVERKVEQSDLK